MEPLELEISRPVANVKAEAAGVSGSLRRHVENPLESLEMEAA
jgi:hypothetical protein